ncbi:MAG: hypothetical protein AAGJ81_08240 [Verrucomicrobiota bacterium]
MGRYREVKPLVSVARVFRDAVRLWRDRELTVREVENLPGHAAKWMEAIDEGLLEAAEIAVKLENDLDDLADCLEGDDEFTVARREILIERTVAAAHSLREGLACVLLLALSLFGVFAGGPGEEEFVRRGGRDSARLIRIVRTGKCCQRARREEAAA